VSASDHPEISAELRDHIQRDPWAAALGIQYLDLRRGYVAFGAACNSHGEPAVALNVTIAFLAAVKPDATLIAEGREKKQGRRAGFYEIEVTTEDGVPVALAHCVAHRVGR